MSLGPLTFVFTLGLILSVVIGVIIVIRAFGACGQDSCDRSPHAPERDTGTICPHCEKHNPNAAKYCSRCGAALP